MNNTICETLEYQNTDITETLNLVDNNLIYKNPITDFKGWGYGVLSIGGSFGVFATYGNSKYLDREYMGGLINDGLLGWGDTPEDAFLKARVAFYKTVRKTFKKDKKTNYRQSMEDKKLFLFYRISPAAKKYLDENGFYLDNYGFTDIGLVRVPFSVDDRGYPVNYVIDLLDESTKREKMDISVLRTNEYKDLEDSYKNYSIFIHHNKEPIKHKIISVKDIGKNIDKSNIDRFNYAACVYENNRIFGFGSTPIEAYKNANKFIDFIKDKNNNQQQNNQQQNNQQQNNQQRPNIVWGERLKTDFQLFFSIRPLSTRAKKYISMLGYDLYQNAVSKIWDPVGQCNGILSLVPIPPIMLENGYPTEFVIDLTDKKAIAISNLL